MKYSTFSGNIGITVPTLPSLLERKDVKPPLNSEWRPMPHYIGDLQLGRINSKAISIATKYIQAQVQEFLKHHDYKGLENELMGVLAEYAKVMDQRKQRQETAKETAKDPEKERQEHLKQALEQLQQALEQPQEELKQVLKQRVEQLQQALEQALEHPQEQMNRALEQLKPEQRKELLQQALDQPHEDLKKEMERMRETRTALNRTLELPQEHFKKALDNLKKALEKPQEELKCAVRQGLQNLRFALEKLLDNMRASFHYTEIVENNAYGVQGEMYNQAWGPPKEQLGQAVKKVNALYQIMGGTPDVIKRFLKGKSKGCEEQDSDMEIIGEPGVYYKPTSKIDFLAVAQEKQELQQAVKDTAAVLTMALVGEAKKGQNSDKEDVEEQQKNERKRGKGDAGGDWEEEEYRRLLKKRFVEKLLPSP